VLGLVLVRVLVRVLVLVLVRVLVPGSEIRARPGRVGLGGAAPGRDRLRAARRP
jgi:hypothetical protein